jgi:hypothetical protein
MPNLSMARHIQWTSDLVVVTSYKCLKVMEVEQYCLYQRIIYIVHNRTKDSPALVQETSVDVCFCHGCCSAVRFWET